MAPIDKSSFTLEDGSPLNASTVNHAIRYMAELYADLSVPHRLMRFREISRVRHGHDSQSATILERSFNDLIKAVTTLGEPKESATAIISNQGDPRSFFQLVKSVMQQEHQTQSGIEIPATSWETFETIVDEITTLERDYWSDKALLKLPPPSRSYTRDCTRKGLEQEAQLDTYEGHIARRTLTRLNSLGDLSSPKMYQDTYRQIEEEVRGKQRQARPDDNDRYWNLKETELGESAFENGETGHSGKGK